jgi:hypothetical protein
LWNFPEIAVAQHMAQVAKQILSEILEAAHLWLQLLLLLPAGTSPVEDASGQDTEQLIVGQLKVNGVPEWDGEISTLVDSNTETECKLEIMEEFSGEDNRLGKLLVPHMI